MNAYYKIRVDSATRARWEAAAKSDRRTLAAWMRARLDEAAESRQESRQPAARAVTYRPTLPALEAMVRLRDNGPEGWARGKGRAGGSTARLFGRLVAAGLVAGPPYELTDAGRATLAAWFAGLKDPAGRAPK